MGQGPPSDSLNTAELTVGNHHRGSTSRAPPNRWDTANRTAMVDAMADHKAINGVHCNDPCSQRFRKVVYSVTGIFGALYVAAIICIGRYHAQLDDSMVEETGRWLSSAILPSFVALVATYVWMLSRNKKSSDRYFNVVSLPLTISGVWWFLAVVSLGLGPFSEISYWAIFGLITTLFSLVYQFIALLPVVKFWQEWQKV